MKRRRWLSYAAAAPGWALLTHAARSAEVVPRPLVFPRDFGAHPEFRTEWWYATGTLQAQAADGAAARPDAGARGDAPPAYGFQLTFFRSRTDLAGANPSRHAARQLLFAHAALTDLRAGRLLHAERIARWNGRADAADPRTGASEADTDIRLAGWHLRRDGPPADSVYRAHLADRDAGFGFTLELATTQPPLLQGHAGVSRKGPAPQKREPLLLAAAAGGARRAGARRRAPAGGRQRLARPRMERGDICRPARVGWDWIGMNLDDGAALMAFRIRRADGSALWAGGAWRPRGGAVRAFAP